MATVWAFREGNFTTTTSSGWSNTIRFNALADLVSQMDKAKLAGQVTKMVIVAHGDAAGQVQLDQTITNNNLDSFKDALGQLGRFLTDNAQLMFFACLAGEGKFGDDLLTRISAWLPGRFVIGFVITGVTSNLPSVPGQVYELPNGESYAGFGVPAAKLKGVKMLTEESIYSKWARNGVIVRKDALEQNRDPKHRCARPGCPGHKSATDRCFP